MSSKKKKQTVGRGAKNAATLYKVGWLPSIRSVQSAPKVAMNPLGLRSMLAH